MKADEPKKNYPITPQVAKAQPESVKARGFLKALVNHTYLEKKVPPKSELNAKAILKGAILHRLINPEMPKKPE